MHKDEDLLRLIEEFGGYRRPKWRRPMALVILLVLFVWLSTKACGSVVKLAWNPNPETDVAGYQVSWGTASGTYTNTKIVNGRETVTTVMDNLAGATTYYFALKAFNTAGLYSDYSLEISHTTAPDAPVLVNSGWKVIEVSSEELAREDTAGSNAIDGNIDTFWHSVWEAQPPHSIAIDLGKPAVIDAISYLPRQDESLNGTFGKWKIEYSLDNITWLDWHTSEWALTSVEKRTNLPTKEVRYVRLTSITSTGNYGSAAEIGFLGVYADTLPPTIVYASPNWSAAYPASYAIDGDPNTLWATLGDEVPNTITVDLRSEQWIKGLIYTPRQDAWDNGHIGDYTVYLSQDGTNFFQVAAGAFTTLNRADKAILFRASQARYYRLVVNSALQGGGHIAIGELKVINATGPDQSTVTVAVDSTTDLKNWTERANFTNPALDKEFYRLRINVNGRTIVKIIELQTAPTP